MGTGETAPSVECWLLKHRGLSLISSAHVKSLPVIQELERQRQEDAWICWLALQHNW